LRILRKILPSGRKIVNSLVDVKSGLVSAKDKKLLKTWASVRASVGASVGDSVRASVWDSVWDGVWDSVGDIVWDSVWDSVGDIVWDSVWASVGASVGDSVRDSVGASVGASVGDSVWAYIGLMFALPRDAWKYTEKIKTRGYPFQPCVDLWNRGFVPSFDGKTWRLHAGPKAKIVYEWTPEKKK
jgi:hypothetical protein